MQRAARFGRYSVIVWFIYVSCGFVGVPCHAVFGVVESCVYEVTGMWSVRLDH